MNEGERIASLEEAMRSTRADINEIKTDLKAILATLAAMSGGRKAVIGLFGILGTAIGAIGTFFGLHHN